ncbi:acyl-CoA dehydrogenase family protein [Frankia gtarii]|uniref:acyl-CoA dehydrogenase family protein n=1 Tax=Frankia gtarii TaxID=2950102 RepID=UPI0021C0B6E1|nr:acyl-CoA dehydrogenase family protein [Frankia gtarii]
MSLSFSEEREELRAVVRSFLEASSPESTVRTLMETADGYDPRAWEVMGGQLGLQGLALPEEYGGAGFGFAELGVVFEEMGRVVFGSPFLATVLAGQAILRIGDDRAAADLLPGIASGETIATLAVQEANGDWDEAAGTTRATASADGWRIEGTKMFVLDGCAADLLVVAARTGAGVGLFTVDAAALGLRRTPLATLDQTRKQARVDFDHVSARLLGAEGQGAAVVEQMRQLAVVALAAEQAGGAARVLDMAVAYAGTRMQFGRPIGSFQAIKHTCADVLIEVESARSAAYQAVAAAAAGDPELPLVASLAAAYCSDAYVHAAAANIQIHGGIGFTWEHSAHLFYKRATSSRLMFGDPASHRERVARLLPV